jgi:hypothetical protein
VKPVSEVNVLGAHEVKNDFADGCSGTDTCLEFGSQRMLFSNAGYVEVRLFEEKSKGWFCGVGQKP